MTIKCKKCGTEYLPPAPHECDWGCGPLTRSIIIMAALLVGCTSNQPLQTNVMHTRFVVDITVVEPGERPPCVGINIQGCYREGVENGQRVVYLVVPKPSHQDDLRSWCIWGHELGHGVFELWHGTEPKGC